MIRPPNIEKSASVSKKLQQRVEKLSKTLKKYEERLQRLQQIRLILGLGLCFLFLGIAVDKSASWLLAPTLIVLGLFIVSVFVHKKFVRFKSMLVQYRYFLSRQGLRVDGQNPNVEWESIVKLSREMGLPQDLGLVGSQSLFSLLDECFSDQGRKLLLQRMTETPEVSVIKQRQQQIKTLSKYLWTYIKMKLRVDQGEVKASGDQLREFVKSSFVDKSFTKLLYANVGVWIFTVVIYFIKVKLAAPIPNFIFVLFPFLSLYSINTVHQVFLSGVGLQNYLGILAPVFKLIEDAASKDLVFAKEFSKISKYSPAKQAKRLETYLSFLSTQTNPILHFLLNVFFPWTILSVFLVEKSRKDLQQSLPDCLRELAEFEFLGCMLVLHKYQTQVFPQIMSDSDFSFNELYHPLINREKVVSNSLSFSNGKKLGLLTGSNMSGKSTFLRTVGLNQVLANMGAPVFAEELKTTPLKVVTCIEVSDSLRDGYSYFYAEVRRLKDIIVEAENGTSCLYLIDEIFRGTNNKERQLGSKAVIETLASVQTSMGFISTHDLELTQLGDKMPPVLNLHFREEITATGEMVFYYKLQLGPSQTTNALRIMKAEGLRVDMPE